jgi:hypothetical protein
MRILLLRVLVGALAIIPICIPLSAQDHSDLAIVGRIKTEAFENSQVMDTLEYLTDQYGPRLTVSPEWREAADWAVKRLQGYGLENVHLEKWGAPGRGWTRKGASLDMLEPRYSAMVAATGGGFGLLASFSGSTTATPSCVGNNSLPFRVLHPAGQNPPLHSILRIPSRFPYWMEVMVLVLPAAKSFSCFMLTR